MQRNGNVEMELRNTKTHHKVVRHMWTLLHAPTIDQLIPSSEQSRLELACKQDVLTAEPTWESIESRKKTWQRKVESL